MWLIHSEGFHPLPSFISSNLFNPQSLESVCKSLFTKHEANIHKVFSLWGEFCWRHLQLLGFLARKAFPTLLISVYKHTLKKQVPVKKSLSPFPNHSPCFHLTYSISKSGRRCTDGPCPFALLPTFCIAVSTVERTY